MLNFEINANRNFLLLQYPTESYWHLYTHAHVHTPEQTQCGIRYTDRQKCVKFVSRKLIG